MKYLNMFIELSDKKRKIIDIGTFIFLAVCYAASAGWFFQKMDFENTFQILSVMIGLFVGLFDLILFVFCMTGYTVDKIQQLLFQLMVIVLFFLTISVSLVSFFLYRPQRTGIAFTLCTVLHLLSGVYWLFFWFYQVYNNKGGKKIRSIHFLFGFFIVVYFALVIANCFHPFIFLIDAGGECRFPMPYFTICTYLCFFATFYLYIFMSSFDAKTRLTLFSYIVLPLFTTLLLGFVDSNSLLAQLSSSVLVLAYLLSMYFIFFNIYLANENKLLIQEKEFTESRVNAMVLQINPHFIANTLSSIAGLCDPGAPEAMELTMMFSQYLRDNYTDLTASALISFDRELEHLKNYLAIEQVRFPELKVIYEIETSDFELPTLTVQPLVENAIRHGIRKRPRAAGTIRIKTYADEAFSYVFIEDDGVGFSEMPKDEKKHIGISNSRMRLKLLCKGTLEIRSEPGKGTVSEIRIPRKREETEE